MLSSLFQTLKVQPLLFDNNKKEDRNVIFEIEKFGCGGTYHHRS